MEDIEKQQKEQETIEETADVDNKDGNLIKSKVFRAQIFQLRVFCKNGFLAQYWNFVSFFMISVQKLSKGFLSENFRVLMYCAWALKDNIKSCMYNWKK